jgi:hypothetical protein
MYRLNCKPKAESERRICGKCTVKTAQCIADVPCDGKERKLQDSMCPIGYIQNTALSEKHKLF